MNVLNVLSKLYFERIGFTFLTLVITFLGSALLQKGIDVIFSNVRRRVRREVIIAKTQTVRHLLKNVVQVVLFFIAVLLILANWGINIAPILTGAGILGLAVSFGSQTLVKDVISGFFIILEDQYNLGDKIKIDKYEGNVHNITLRMTVLKDSSGNLIYIPNSQITTVTRYNTQPQINTFKVIKRGK